VIATSLPVMWKVSLIFLAGLGAGISNGVAGGGTFVSFPTLLAVGIPSLQANVSSSVGILPSVLGGVRVFGEELRRHRRLLLELIPSCVIGSLCGTGLLFLGSEHTFRSVVPWLIGGATGLFALAPWITRLLARRQRGGPEVVRRRALFVGILVASAYGGYFGAGLGIVLLAVMALTLPYDIYVLQGLRVTMGLIINAVAAVVFIARGHLALQAVIILLIGSVLGGWLGTMLIRRLSPTLVRSLIILIGATTTIRLAVGG
jgi:uncharacterized protein